MESFGKFVRTTLAGGILFMIPLVIAFAVIRKALELMKVITDPLGEAIKGELFWGLDGSKLLGILLLLVFCFLGGLLFRVSVVQSSIGKLEQKFLSFVPGYTLLKSLAIDALSESKAQAMIPILFKGDGSYRPGFLVEEKDNLCTVFFPEPPQANSGELQIVPSDDVVRLSISSNAMNHMIRSLGKGILEHVPK